MATCNIPNCGRSCPADKPFCAQHGYEPDDWKRTSAAGQSLTSKSEDGSSPKSPAEPRLEAGDVEWLRAIFLGHEEYGALIGLTCGPEIEGRKTRILAVLKEHRHG
jgi:hypothetical protein